MPITRLPSADVWRRPREAPTIGLDGNAAHAATPRSMPARRRPTSYVNTPILVRTVYAPRTTHRCAVAPRGGATLCHCHRYALVTSGWCVVVAPGIDELALRLCWCKHDLNMTQQAPHVRQSGADRCKVAQESCVVQCGIAGRYGHSHCTKTDGSMPCFLVSIS